MLSETDLNLLESYLDDELSASEVERIDVRISEEPEVAAALDTLRKERSSRAAVFAALTPSEQQADRFSRTLLSSLRARELSGRMFRGAMIIGGIAACLLIGFAVGWMGRGTSHPPQIATPTTPGPANGTNQLIVDGGANAAATGKYSVPVFDESGACITVQRFKNKEEAGRFAEDLKRYEARLKQVRQGLAEPVSDQF